MTASIFVSMCGTRSGYVDAFIPFLWVAKFSSFVLHLRVCYALWIHSITAHAKLPRGVELSKQLELHTWGNQRPEKDFEIEERRTWFLVQPLTVASWLVHLVGITARRAFEWSGSGLCGNAVKCIDLLCYQLWPRARWKSNSNGKLSVCYNDPRHNCQAP